MHPLNLRKIHGHPCGKGHTIPFALTGSSIHGVQIGRVLNHNKMRRHGSTPAERLGSGDNA